MADFDAYRKEDDEAILEAYQTLTPDGFQSRAASIARDRVAPVEEVEARAKFLDKQWRKSQGTSLKTNGVSTTSTPSSRKTRSSPRNISTGAGKASDASSIDESSSDLAPIEEEFAMLTEEYFFAHPTSKKKLAFWFVELHASEELTNAINDKKDSMTEPQWKKSGKLSLFVRKSKKGAFEAFKAEYKRKLHDGYRRPEMEAVLSNIIGGDEESAAAAGDLSVTISQDAEDDEFDETGVYPPQPIDIKPRHKRGDPVFAAWIDNLVEEGELSWFSGTVSGYNVTEKRGHYGEGRTYNIEFDDGDVDQDLKDIYVMSRKDYFLTENGFTSGRKSDIIRVSGVGDEYAETVGWYKTEQTGNKVFALLSDAVKARDEQVVNKKGQYVTEADLLFPQDWDFPEEFASRMPTYTGQAKIDFDDDIDAEKSPQRSSPRRQQSFRVRGAKTDDKESPSRLGSRGNGSVKRSNGERTRRRHKRRRQDVSEGVMNGHPTTDAHARTYSEIDLLKSDLAVAHRLCAKFGLGTLSQTHLSVRYGSECLICDLPTAWSSVTPENISVTSTDIDAVHRGIYNSREDVKAVIHLRSLAATAVSCLEDGFQFLSYDSAPFHKKLAACECRGDSEAVSKTVAVAACSADGCNTILLQNNGFVCFGQSMRDAWILAQRFEECSKLQLEVMKSGGKPREMNDSDFVQAAESGIAQDSTPPCSWDDLSESVGL